jgi:hypothetical protein
VVSVTKQTEANIWSKIGVYKPYASEKKRLMKLGAHPATWPPEYQALQSSTIEKLRDRTHASVPKYGISMSWSPLKKNVWEHFGVKEDWSYKGMV